MGIGDEDFPGAAIAQWYSVHLSTGRLCVRFAGTEGIAVALLGQDRSP